MTQPGERPRQVLPRGTRAGRTVTAQKGASLCPYHRSGTRVTSGTITGSGECERFTQGARSMDAGNRLGLLALGNTPTRFASTTRTRKSCRRSATRPLSPPRLRRLRQSARRQNHSTIPLARDFFNGLLIQILRQPPFHRLVNRFAETVHERMHLVFCNDQRRT
jgi:hypothetical protein